MKITIKYLNLISLLILLCGCATISRHQKNSEYESPGNEIAGCFGPFPSFIDSNGSIIFDRFSRENKQSKYLLKISIVNGSGICTLINRDSVNISSSRGPIINVCDYRYGEKDVSPKLAIKQESGLNDVEDKYKGKMSELAILAASWNDEYSVKFYWFEKFGNNWIDCKMKYPFEVRSQIYGYLNVVHYAYTVPFDILMLPVYAVFGIVILNYGGHGC